MNYKYFVSFSIGNSLNMRNIFVSVEEKVVDENSLKSLKNQVEKEAGMGTVYNLNIFSFQLIEESESDDNDQ